MQLSRAFFPAKEWCQNHGGYLLNIDNVEEVSINAFYYNIGIISSSDSNYVESKRTSRFFVNYAYKQ